MAFHATFSLPESNIYEVNIRQYTREGTINAFSLHLPRLRRMGIDILWFMPLTPISIQERKGTLGSYYAAADYWTINPEFGQPEDFKRLVDLAHQLGFKVIIDWVTNHTGWSHTWTKTHPEFYLKNDAGSFCERNGWEDVIDLDYRSATMRQAMISAMQFWIDRFDIDGFRCDMAMLVPLDFWTEARNELDRTKSLIWLAECQDPEYLTVFDMIYGWEWMHLTAAVARGHQNKNQLKQLLVTYQSRTNENRNICLFTSNHDENSWNGTEYERYGQAALLFAALNILLPGGVPLIYSGQELPLTHRLRFFDKDEIPWTTDVPRLEGFYRTLLLLRKTNPNFININAGVAVDSLVLDDRVFSLHLGTPGRQDLLGIFNLSNSEVTFQLNENQLIGEYKNVLTDDRFNPSFENMMQLSPFDFRVYENTNNLILV